MKIRRRGAKLKPVRKANQAMRGRGRSIHANNAMLTARRRHTSQASPTSHRPATVGANSGSAVQGVRLVMRARNVSPNSDWIEIEGRRQHAGFQRLGAIGRHPSAAEQLRAELGQKKQSDDDQGDRQVQEGPALSRLTPERGDWPRLNSQQKTGEDNQAQPDGRQGVVVDVQVRGCQQDDDSPRSDGAQFAVGGQFGKLPYTALRNPIQRPQQERAKCAEERVAVGFLGIFQV